MTAAASASLLTWIDMRAEAAPDALALLFANGPEWTWHELRLRVRDHAQALQALGVRQGDLVLSWMPSSPIGVLNFYALACLGAVYVPINTSYRGEMLAHVLRSSGARLMIAHGGLVARLEEVDLARLETLVVVGDERPRIPAAVHDRTALAGEGAKLRAPERPIEDHDDLMIIYTSGTTGPSKGVLCSHRHARMAALGFRNVGPGDRSLVTMPLYHVGGIYALLWALVHGSSAVVVDGFRTTDFWPLVRRYGITTTGLLGSMVDFLNGLPPDGDDRRHGLRSVVIAPYGPAAMTFAARHGVDVYTEFNMSELSVPLFCGPNPGIVGTCGVPSPGVSLRICDANDEEVADGEPGELLVRMDRPWTISHGYHNDDKATAAAWRNGWFHTGDIFRRDEQGHYHFVDRAKDAIRRRGENISSFEVENALLTHPAVAEACAIGVPAPNGSEQEVMAVLRLTPGAAFEPSELISFLEPRMPHYMIPRFVRVVADFPRTPTQKIEKHRLRAEGLTADSWDREAAGIVIRSARLEVRG